MKEKTDHSLGEHIREVRQTQGLTQKEFAESLGIAQGYLSSIERGRQTPSDTLIIALRHLYGIEAPWLESGPGKGTLATARFSAGTPLLKSISADFPGGVKLEDILGHVTLPESRPDEFAIKAYGDFMAPTIQDSDLVLFRPGGEAGSGDVVLVNNKWGDILLRRYRVNNDGIWLTPDNSAYTPFQPAEDLRILGIVTDVWRKVKL